MTDKPADANTEEEWRAIERLDAGEPPQSEQEASLRAPYQALIDRVRATDEAAAPPEGWEARALGRFSQGRRRRRWGAAGAGAAVVAGVMAAIVLLRCQPKPERGLEIAVLDPSHQVRRGVEPAVGDTLSARARGSVLLYLGPRRIAACPGSERCRSEGGWHTLSWRFKEAGAYSVVTLSKGGAPLVPADGVLDLDWTEARKQDAHKDRREIVVAP
jgi:hypothetical protein